MRLLLPAISALVLALAPATAVAGTVTGTNGQYQYQDVPGNQTNNLTITAAGDDIIFNDPAGVVDNSTECVPDGAAVRCDSGAGDPADTYTVDAILAGGND